MKFKIGYIIVFTFLFLNMKGNAQNHQSSSEVTLFAQAIFSIESQDVLTQLEQEMKLNPYIKLVRLDWHTQRLFLLTKEISGLTEVELLSWFNGYVDTINCVQIGVQGIDQITKYPFTNCEN